MKERRDKWRGEQPFWDAERLVFLDESGAKTNMARFRGRIKGGARLRDSAPAGHWATTTMLSSIRLDGKTACMSVDGPTTSEVFREYVRQVLAPTLGRGDLVVLDNLSSHKDTQALRLIEEAGAEARFLPPYSPDFNPMENMWSKIKESPRSAKARTRDTLDQAIAAALLAISAEDAQGWFKACGYGIS